jgi:hypothetical protein
MLTLTEIFAIIIIHWIADFIFQDEKWALGKSKNWGDLLKHTFTYSTIWYAVFLLFAINGNHFNGPKLSDLGWSPYMGLFPIITFIFHTVTDYFTSRIVSKKFTNKQYGSEIPNFGAFTIIGIDQVLHYIQLFLTYYLLKK